MATIVSRQSTIVQKIEDETLEEIGSMKRVKLIIFVVPLIYFCGVYALFHLPVLFHHPSHASLQSSSFSIFNQSLFEFTLPSATVLNDSPPVSWFAFALPSYVKSHAPRDLLPSVLPTIVASPMGPAIDVVHFCWALAFFATFFIDFSSGLSAGSNDPLRRGMAMLLCTVNFMAMITYTLARYTHQFKHFTPLVQLHHDSSTECFVISQISLAAVAHVGVDQHAAFERSVHAVDMFMRHLAVHDGLHGPRSFQESLPRHRLPSDHDRVWLFGHVSVASAQLGDVRRVDGDLGVCAAIHQSLPL
jgi:hypothetical protein